MARRYKMLGLNRTGGYLRGFPITLPHNFGNPITLPHDFGNDVVEPHDFGNEVTWTPSPSHFGNTVPESPTTYVGSTNPFLEDDILLEDGDSIELEDGSGNILLEN
jgi:hypothetical protein